MLYYETKFKYGSGRYTYTSVNTNTAFLSHPFDRAMYNSNGSSTPIVTILSFADFSAGTSRGVPHDPSGQHENMITPAEK